MKKITAMGLFLVLVACGSKTQGGADASSEGQDGGIANADEMGQAVADTMASVAAGNGAYAWNAPFDRKARERPLMYRLIDLAVPSAHAATCSLSALNCDSGVKDRVFNNCTTPNGQVSLTGDVKFQYSKSDCTFTAAGDTITRNPNFSFTVSGRSITVKSSSLGGQLVTKTGSGFTMEVPGIERIGKVGGSEVFHFTTKTDSAFVVTKNLASLSIPSGKLVIDESVSGYHATVSCNSISWPATCTCPTSGVLSGTLTTPTAGSHAFSVTFDGCGSGIVSVDGASMNVDFYSCWGI
jgi:hypothetical protein